MFCPGFAICFPAPILTYANQLLIPALALTCAEEGKRSWPLLYGKVRCSRDNTQDAMSTVSKLPTSPGAGFPDLTRFVHLSSSPHSLVKCQKECRQNIQKMKQSSPHLLLHSLTSCLTHAACTRRQPCSKAMQRKQQAKKQTLSGNCILGLPARHPLQKQASMHHAMCSYNSVTPGAIALWTCILQQLYKPSYCFHFCMLVGGDSPASVRCLVVLRAATSQRLQT